MNFGQADSLNRPGRLLELAGRFLQSHAASVRLRPVRSSTCGA
jgi:hypothetical protein